MARRTAADVIWDGLGVARKRPIIGPQRPSDERKPRTCPQGCIWCLDAHTGNLASQEEDHYRLPCSDMGPYEHADSRSYPEVDDE